jgi:flagellar hook-associated protein 3 FlgL
MTSVSIGDMAQAFLLRRQTTAVKADLSRLTEELGSGRRSDLGAAVGGDFRTLAGIDHSLAVLASLRTATSEAAQFATALQGALETAHTLAAGLSPALTSAGTTGGATHVATAAFDARQKLHSAVAALNARAADRYLLSGTATDQKPILGSDQILTALNAAIAGQSTAAGVIAAVAGWFDAPAGGGGYLDTIYGGSAAPPAPFPIGEGDTAAIGLTAATPEIREVLKGLALAALVAEGALGGDLPARAALLRTAGETLLTATAGLTERRADLGSVEAHIDHIATRNAAQTAALELARNGIVAADPFATASEIESVRTQLEMLHVMTARLSRLSLVDFLT